MTAAYNAVASAALAYVTTNNSPSRADFVAKTARLEGLTGTYVDMVRSVLVATYPNAFSVLA